MFFARFILLVFGLQFMLYGLFCIINPTTPIGYLGLESIPTAGSVEVMAMLGGMKLALGAHFCRCGFDSQRTLNGIGMLLVLVAVVAITRAAGLARYGLDDYNVAVVLYELVTILLAWLAYGLAKKHQEPMFS